MIKTFRGLIADGAQDTVVLHTNNGSTGYRIVNLQVMTAAPFTESEEHILKIYTVEQPLISSGPDVYADGVVDFSDQTAIINSHSSGYSSPSIPVIVFDRDIVNQDIFITHVDVQSTKALNYYIELEQVKLALDENTVATLKDIRNVVQLR